AERGRRGFSPRLRFHVRSLGIGIVWMDCTSALQLRKGYAPMLVLSRKKNESIVINNDITITVVEIRGDKVRLGIVAPKDVPVHRKEVYDAIHGTNGSSTPAPVVVNKNVDPAPRTA